jgi:DNA repair protein RecN (Recombination protein N)
MLKRLYISNFALINEMDVMFPGQLTVITGETGAGKSIFLEALSLALGKRADLDALKNKNKKCIVEAEFDVSALDLKSFFTENELPEENNLLLRREISADGKSRSFLNDGLVSLSVLKNLAEKLIDIHSQHQTLLLNQGNFQMEIVDAFSGNMQPIKEYKQLFQKYNKLQTVLKGLQEQEAQARKDLDYHQFLFNELSETELKEGQLAALEEESLALENAGSIQSNLLQTAEGISGGDNNILAGLAAVKQSLNAISKYGVRYRELYERINSAYIELKELSADLEDAGNSVQVNNERLLEVNERIDRISRLLKKHQVSTEEGLLKIRDEIEGKLSMFGSLESDIKKTQNELDGLLKACTKIARELSKTRSQSVNGIESQVKEMLAELSMQNAAFKIEISQSNELGALGFDQVKFLFSANKGGTLNELHKVASGGELSRLMLTLKALLATRKNLPAIVFDEIDTGVSGDVADKIGNILLKMGKSMQVIAITHLPQMASKGKHHLFVYKNEDEDRTVSHIKELSKEERITEIAKMLSTSNPTVSALKNARELLSA